MDEEALVAAVTEITLVAAVDEVALVVAVAEMDLVDAVDKVALVAAVDAVIPDVLQSQIQDFHKEGAPFVRSAKSTRFSGGGVVAEFFRGLRKPM